MTDTQDIEKQPLLNNTIQNSTTLQATKTNSDEVIHFSFANYFENPENEADNCGQCIGETFCPCIPTNCCCPKPCCGWRSPPFFWTVNYLALIGHLINTIITLFYFFTKDDVVYDLKEISEAWTNETGTNMCTMNMPPNSFDARVITAANRTMCISYNSTTTATVSLFNLIIWFHLLSFLFQTLAMFDWNFPLCCCCSKRASGERNGFVGLCDSLCGCRCIRKRYVDEVIDDGTNMLRMVEYSMSATLMQVAIALVLGIDSRLEIISIAALTIIVMLLGLIAEQLKKTMFKTAWFSHLLGWFAMAAVWLLIFQKFNHSVEMSKADGGNGPPDFVFVMILSIALMYMGFGLLQLSQLIWITLYSTTGPLFNKNIETGYNFMSLTSKTFLGYFLLANVLFAPRTINQCLAKESEADWNDLGCNVTMFNAQNVTGLGDIEPVNGYKSCDIKCDEMDANFTVVSEANRCSHVDNWAARGCIVTDENATTVSELNASANFPLFSSCKVTCPVDNGNFVVESVLRVACTAVDTPVGCDNACTSVDEPYAGCTLAVCTAANCPYEGCVVPACTNSHHNDAYCAIQDCTTNATTPHEGCTVQACTTNITTPYVGCAVAACTEDVTTPYVGCNAADCTTSDITPYVGCLQIACTNDMMTPYVGCDTTCIDDEMPYATCTVPECTAADTPYGAGAALYLPDGRPAGCTIPACTTNATTPYDGCTVAPCTQDANTPYPGCDTTCTDVANPYPGCTVAACTDTDLPYAGCNNACIGVNVPYPGCTIQECTTDNETPYDGCFVAQCTVDGNTPYPGCIAEDCITSAVDPYEGCEPVDCLTSSSDPYEGCDPPECTAADLPYPGCNNACQAVNVPYPGCTLHACTTAADLPYPGCIVHACTDQDTPYVGCTVVACTTNATTPYDGCAIHACTDDTNSLPYVGCDTQNHN